MIDRHKVNRPTTREDIATAAATIGDLVRYTPVLDLTDAFARSDMPVGTVTAKLELLQHTGSFKARGALYRARTSAVTSAGLIAASGGNHGLAVAWVAKVLDLRAEIFVPEVSPPAKVSKLRELGATVHVTGALYDDAREACVARQRQTGALDIHAYDHLDTIAATGTIAREIDEQSGGVDTVLVSVGGGGLAAGLAAWWADTATSVIAVEPATSSCYAAAVEAGRPVDVSVGGVAADSLGARRVGVTNWNALRAGDARPVLVADDAITDAQRRLWASARLIVEAGGAAAAAALWSGAYVPAPEERVAVVVCGANVDPALVA